jgi:hypothetical protein
LALREAFDALAATAERHGVDVAALPGASAAASADR